MKIKEKAYHHFHSQASKTCHGFYFINIKVIVATVPITMPKINVNKNISIKPCFFNVLAYPYGVPPKDMQEEISDKFGYNIELMVTEGVNRKLEDFKALNRFAVDGFENPSQLERRMKFYKGLKFLNRRARTLR